MTHPDRAIEAGARAQPAWAPDDLSRLLGAIDGYAHSIIAIRRMAGIFDSSYCGRFPKHHTRKIERRDAITKPLRSVADSLEADMRRCQATYKREHARMLAAAQQEQNDASK